jgi:putative phosphoribosyl transferase
VAAIVDGAEPQLVIDEPVLRDTGLARSVIDDEARRQLREIERRRITYLQGRAPIAVEGRTAIVVDDGIATGTTMRAALRGLRRRRPAHLVLAVPVAPAETIAALQAEVDRIVCLAQPDPFYAIGAFYRDFHQLDDQEVIDLLAAADRLGPAGSGPR